MLAHMFNPRTQERGGSQISMSLKTTWSKKPVPDQLWLPSETIPNKQANERNTQKMLN